MSVKEIRTAIAELPPGELTALMEWIEECQANAWDQQIARDAEAGRFDKLRQRVREQKEAGQCRPL